MACATRGVARGVSNLAPVRSVKSPSAWQVLSPERSGSLSLLFSYHFGHDFWCRAVVVNNLRDHVYAVPLTDLDKIDKNESLIGRLQISQFVEYALPEYLIVVGTHVTTFTIRASSMPVGYFGYVPGTMVQMYHY